MGKLTPAESVERGHDNTASKYKQPGEQQDVPESDMKTQSENKPEIESQCYSDMKSKSDIVRGPTMNCDTMYR